MADEQRTNCRWCGMIHGPKCPSVKAMEFHLDGTVKRVEFYSPVDYPPMQIYPGGTTPILRLSTTWCGGAFPIPSSSGHTL